MMKKKHQKQPYLLLLLLILLISYNLCIEAREIQFSSNPYGNITGYDLINNISKSFPAGPEVPKTIYDEFEGFFFGINPTQNDGEFATLLEELFKDNELWEEKRFYLHDFSREQFFFLNHLQQHKHIDMSDQADEIYILSTYRKTKKNLERDKRLIGMQTS